MVDQLSEYLNRAVDLVGPNAYLQAGMIVIVAMILSSIARRLISRVCQRLARRSATDIDDRFLQILERPVYMTVLLVGLAVAASRLPMSEKALFVTVASLKTIGLMIWAGFALRLSRQMLTLLAGVRDKFPLVDSRTQPLLQNTLALIIALATIYGLMSAWHIDVTALLASAGIVGLALSFAAKDTLSNVFAGVSILADVPYKVGDFVVVESGERGLVTHIGLRSSRLLTRDDVEITIPNAVIGNAKIINESGGPHEKFRVRAKTGIAYGSDLDHVCEVLANVARSHAEICKDPAPRVRVRGFGDFGIDVELLAWVDTPVLRGRLLHELYIEIYKAFDREKIEIPYPKHEVFVKSLPPSAS
jgi:small-conductance mechanosensitive channel